MTREDVRKLLRRWGKIADEIETVEDQIKTICDEIDTVDNLHAQGLDGLPHGTDVGRPTERTAVAKITLAERYQDRLAELNRKLEDLDRFRERIEDALLFTMPDDEYVIRLKYIDGLTFEQIADKMEVTAERVKQRERRGVEIVKEHMEEAWKF